MLDNPLHRQLRRSAHTGFEVEIAGVATAVPSNVIKQTEIMERARKLHPHRAHLSKLFLNTGVEQRHFCRPTDWYYTRRDWTERTAAFTENALDLMERATLEAVDCAGLDLCQIDAIVTNTITGLAVPSLDALLMNRLPFAAHTERLPIFGLGCGGGVSGLARATRVAETMPNGNVLFLAVELCSLTLRIDDPSMAMFVSEALFGDGAAAVVLSNTAGSERAGPRLGRVVAVGEHLWRDTEHIMGWNILNDGFGIVLSPELPTLLQKHFVPALQCWLERTGLSLADFDGFLLHPGSRRLVDVAESALELPSSALSLSRDVLRCYGNMSSATVLFILQRALEAGCTGRHLVTAFGPGFSAYFAAIDL